MALLSIVLCINFAACSDDDDNIGDIAQNENSSENEDKLVKTIYIETAGTLSTLIPKEEQAKVTDLTLSGFLNGTDIKFIREEMHNLIKVDFTDVHIVGGGDSYYTYFYPENINPPIIYRTYDNVFPAYCFFYRSLCEIKLPKSVTTIGKSAFEGCTDLTSVEIPNGITSIGMDAFSGCNNLTYVKIPNSVTDISYAFEDCTGLTSVEIPDGVTSLYGTFKGCTNLTTVEIPMGVTNMNFAFEECTNLTSVNIPNGVTDLGGAFMGCTKLTSIEIPNSVTDITNAFSDCVSLTSVEIPNSVTKIMWAFDGCTSLTSVKIPSSVTEIGRNAFLNCSALKDIHVGNPTPPDVDDNAFSTYSYVTLYVPVGSKDAYMQHRIWGQFGNIIEE